MPPKRTVARKKSTGHILGRPRTPPQHVQFPFGRAHSRHKAPSEENFEYYRDGFRGLEPRPIGSIPRPVIADGNATTRATTIPPETQAETTTENLASARDNATHPGERRDSFAEVLQAVKADNNKMFGDNHAGPSLPKRRWRSASLARPRKLALIEKHEVHNRDGPAQAPRFLEIPQPVRRIPGTPKNLLESAWKYNRYLLAVLERNGIIFDSEGGWFHDGISTYWEHFLEQIETQIEEQEYLVRSGHIPRVPKQEWTAFIHSLRVQSAKDDMNRILHAIAPTRRELAYIKADICHLVPFESRKPWINSFISSRPHPLRSVGVKCSSFACAELDAILGPDSGNTSYYGTKDMLFPFLTFEYNQIDISIADTQGACCMGLAVKGLANLYQRANKSAAIHKIISGFSVSFDRHQVKIWGYCPSFDSMGGVRVHQRLVVFRSLVTPRAVDVDIITGKNNLHRIWLFVKFLYEEWAPEHISGLYNTILQLPEYAPMTESEESQDSVKQV